MRIAIDLTPILPGGTNGGAKIMTLQLIKELVNIAPENKYILLASKKNISEISVLKAPSIDIICVSSPRITLRNAFILFAAILMWPLVKIADKLLLTSISSRVIHKYHQLRSNLMAKDLASYIKADLLFCPFTAPFYHELNIPIVSVIYDLQSHYYPHFFTSEERYERKRNFESACHWATKLVCISDFVRETVLHNSPVSPENVKTIHIRLAHRLADMSKNNSLGVLNRHQLLTNNFLLFPANFWQHKNHQILFTAFNMYRANDPQSTLKLVCTGANNAYKHFLQTAIKDMGLEQWVIMPGYLSDKEFADLVSNCKAIIFPSLYEGFGMPILEAMAAGKPVLCSNLTSIPEVAGLAALQFDPRKPKEIAEAIHRLQSEKDLPEKLIKKGYERILEFGTEADMAREYLTVFHEAVQPN